MNHRLNLQDGILIKNNHISLGGRIANGAGCGSEGPQNRADRAGGGTVAAGTGRSDCRRSRVNSSRQYDPRLA